MSWLGSAYVTLIVCLAAALSVDPAFRLGCYEVLALLNRAVNIPLAFLTLVTGFVLALGTRWAGLHRWIVTKLALSVVVILANQRLTVPGVAATIVALRAGINPGPLPVQVVGFTAGGRRPHRRCGRCRREAVGPDRMGNREVMDKLTRRSFGIMRLPAAAAAVSAVPRPPAGTSQVPVRQRLAVVAASTMAGSSSRSTG